MNIRLDLIAPEIQRTADELRAMCGDDERLLIDMIVGETDIDKIVGRLLDAIEREDGIHAALTAQMAERKERRDMSDQRKERVRAGILRVMKAAGLEKLPLPEATVSVRPVPAKVAVNDADAVPAEYLSFTPKPNMAAIKEAFGAAASLPNWLRSEPASETVMIRRK